MDRIFLGLPLILCNRVKTIEFHVIPMYKLPFGLSVVSEDILRCLPGIRGGQNHRNDVLGPPCHLKSLATRLFVQQLIWWNIHKCFGNIYWVDILHTKIIYAPDRSVQCSRPDMCRLGYDSASAHFNIVAYVTTSLVNHVLYFRTIAMRSAYYKLTHETLWLHVVQ